jgi:AraC-like DNA-binding protein
LSVSSAIFNAPIAIRQVNGFESAANRGSRQGGARQPLDRARQPVAPTFTTLASWAKAIARALEAEGIDSGALFAAAGLDRRLLSDPDARYPQEALNRLWQLAVRATGDEAFGFKVSRQVGATTFHALGYAIIASGTLREIVERAVRYLRVVSTAAEMSFERIGNEYHLRLMPLAHATQPSFESIDAFLSLWLRTFRSRDTRRFDEVFRAPIEYGAGENLLAFDRATIEQPLEDANPQLAALNEQLLVRALAQIDSSDVVARVGAVLGDALRLGEPSAAAVARTLNMSLRSLQRRLHEAGTCYEAVLNDCRRTLARRYLTEARCSVSETAYLLGFSDTSSFTRAFRRWYGCAPTAFREPQAAADRAPTPPPQRGVPARPRRS